MGKKVSDKELVKWSGILGIEKMVSLYIDDEIYLTPKQLDKLNELKNNKKPKRIMVDEFLTEEEKNIK